MIRQTIAVHKRYDIACTQTIAVHKRSENDNQPQAHRIVSVVFLTKSNKSNKPLTWINIAHVKKKSKKSM